MPIDIGYGLRIGIQRLRAGVVNTFAYLIRDEMTTNAAANTMTSPRTCEPGPGQVTLVQTLINTNAYFRIENGLLIGVGGSEASGWHNLAIIAADVERATNRGLVAKVQTGTTSYNPSPGDHWYIGCKDGTAPFDSAETNNIDGGMALWPGANVQYATSGNISVRTLTSLTNFEEKTWMCVMRDSGSISYLDGSIWGMTAVGNAANTNLFISGNNDWNVDFFRVIDFNKTQIQPLVSDSFIRANSASLGTTDSQYESSGALSKAGWTVPVGDLQIVNNAVVSAQNTTQFNYALCESGVDSAQAAAVKYTFDATRNIISIVGAIDADNWRGVSASSTRYAFLEAVGGTVFNRFAPLHSGTITDGDLVELWITRCTTDQRHSVGLTNITTNTGFRNDIYGGLNNLPVTNCSLTGFRFLTDSSTKSDGQQAVYGFSCWPSNPDPLDIGTDTDE